MRGTVSPQGGRWDDRARVPSHAQQTPIVASARSSPGTRPPTSSSRMTPLSASSITGRSSTDTRCCSPRSPRDACRSSRQAPRAALRQRSAALGCGPQRDAEAGLVRRAQQRRQPERSPSARTRRPPCAEGRTARVLLAADEVRVRGSDARGRGAGEKGARARYLSLPLAVAGDPKATVPLRTIVAFDFFASFALPCLVNLAPWSAVPRRVRDRGRARLSACRASR